MRNVEPFALYGAEKMFYDVRMGPQIIEKDGIIYIAYQANDKEIYADPYILTYDTKTGVFSQPCKIGDAERYAFDHHLCPVIWIDKEGFIHALYNCHGEQGSHSVSVRPLDVTQWRDAEVVAPSISYPHIFMRPNGDVVLYFRALGHMGYWCYCVSNDGGYSWTKPIKLVDFDQNPENDADSWAGSYHSAQLSPDGSTLHIGFTYFDERGIWKQIHPLYKRKTSVNSRYNLYYISVDMNSGVVKNLNGDVMSVPFNKKEAEQCMVWNSGDYLTMMPSMLISDNGRDVSFLLPITEETEWTCGFYYFKREHGELKKILITHTNTTWSGSKILRNRDGSLTAYLIVGKKDGSIYTYGAGELERWDSKDNGDSWTKMADIVPIKDYLYNNPTFVESSTNSGLFLSEYLAFYGWEGPYSIQPVIDKPTDIPIVHRGKAFLMKNGGYC